jgi:hypothetical protein
MHYIAEVFLGSAAMHRCQGLTAVILICKTLQFLPFHSIVILRGKIKTHLQTIERERSFPI